MKSNLIIANTLFKLIVIVVICLSFNSRLEASHAMGADFTYKCLGADQYELKLTFYRDCSGISAPLTVPIVLNSVSCGLNFNYNLPQVSFSEISPTCPFALSTCQGGSEPGVEEYIYIDTVTIADPCADWVFSFTHCCRNNSIDNLVNPSSEELYIQSEMNNTGGICNASPVFSSLGVPYLCDTTFTNFNFGAFDVDGDSLVFSLANPLAAGGVPIVYQIPNTVTAPLITTTGTVDFDSTNGQMSFTPSGLQVAVVTVLVQEYRGGILIGSVMRDIQVLIINCVGNVAPEMTSGGIINITNGTLIDTSRVELCIGDALSFDLTFSDANSTDSISIQTNITSAFPTATFTSTGANPTTGTFSWTPTANDVGLNNLIVTISDGACPIMGTQNYAFEVNVLAGTFAGPDVNLCLGDTVQMQAEGGANFQWTPSTGLANDTVGNTMAFPSVTTTYMLTSNFSGSCDTIDSMTIFVAPNFTASIIGDQTICQGGSVQLNADGTPSDAYTFQWSPAAGLDSAQIGTPLATPSVTTTYGVTITSPGLCSRSGSVTVTVDSTILNVTPTTSKTVLCPGGSATLNANINASDTSYTITWEDQNSVVVGSTEIISVSPLTDMTYTAIITNGICIDSKSVDVLMSVLDIGLDSVTLCNGDTLQTNPVFGPVGAALPTTCGISSGCNGSGGINSYVVGTGTATNTSTSYPAPFGNWFKNAKHQILYTAADLQAAGLTAGTITEIGFNVTSIVGTSLYRSYQIKLGCTSISDLTTWETGLVQVFAPTDVTIVPGMNTLVLSSPFEWDGTSNLVMEFCYDNLIDPFTNNSLSPFTTTGYTSVIYYRSDGTPACPFTGTPTTSFDRPNTTFTVCTENIAPTFIWTPSTGVSFDTLVNPSIAPSTSATYNLTMDNGLCIVTDSVYVAFSSAFGLTSSVVDATCGNADGSASVTPSGGSGPFTYLWNDPAAQTNGTATGLTLGSYTLEIIDANGCTENMAISINEPGGPSLLTSQVDLTCFGGSTGSATVTATGGTTPYTYLWNDPAAQTTATAVGLIAGTYVVNVTGGGCGTSITVTLTEPTQMGVVTTNTGLTCFGDCDGTADVVVTGGTAPFIYLWDDPSTQTNATATGLCSGTFNVIYSDAAGCSDSTNVSIIEPMEIVTSISTMLQNACFGDCVGSATISIGSGGVAPFAYLWDDPAAQTNGTATLLCAASYVGTVVDANGCTSSSMAVITEPAVLTTALSPVNACGACNGSITAAVSGGTAPYSYLWSDSTAQSGAMAGNLCQGTYTVIVTDANGCTMTDSATITAPPAFTLTSTQQDLVCGGVCDGQATVSVTGGTAPFLYLWDDSTAQTSATAVGLCTGTYTVTVDDSAGCSGVETVTITGPNPLSADTSSTPATAGSSNGSASVTILGGTNPITYLWNDPSAQTSSTASGLAAGPYTVTILDGAGCSITATVTVSEITGIWDQALGLRFDVYPNPTKGQVIIDLELQEMGAITIQIVTLTGELVYETSQSSVQRLRKEQDLSNLSDGIYFVRLSTKKGTIKRRIVVTK